MPRFDGVIFDMDGTLVRSPLDFAAIRSRLGVPPDHGVLEHIRALAPGDRRRAERTLLDMELAAARQARPAPYARQTLDAVRRAGLKTALLTRNARAVVRRILGRVAMRFDLTMSRDDGPIKPEPDGVLRACRELGIAPRRTACVGDYHYDMVAAAAAGAVGVLLADGASRRADPNARYVIGDLRELPPILGIRGRFDAQ
jgi:HAD superfamily hydrolase (TIGR01509 family)